MHLSLSLSPFIFLLSDLKKYRERRGPSLSLSLSLAYPPSHGFLIYLKNQNLPVIVVALVPKKKSNKHRLVFFFFFLLQKQNSIFGFQRAKGVSNENNTLNKKIDFPSLWWHTPYAYPPP